MRNVLSLCIRKVAFQLKSWIKWLNLITQVTLYITRFKLSDFYLSVIYHICQTGELKKEKLIPSCD